MAVIINIAQSKILERLYFISVWCLPNFAQDSYFRSFKMSKGRQIHSLIIYLLSYLISVRVDKSIVFGGQRIRIEVYRNQSYGRETLCFYKDPLDEIETQRQWQRDRATKSWYYIFL